MVTIHLLPFVRLLKWRIHPNRESGHNSLGEEEAEAEVHWIIESQSTLTEISRAGGNNFDLFVDPRVVWRCCGRLTNADIPYSTRCPVMLHGLRLLLHHTYYSKCTYVGSPYSGMKVTLIKICLKYWIMRGRDLV